jgi:PhnB protein
MQRFADLQGGHRLMGTDAPASTGHTVSVGNNVHLNLEPDTRSETERLFHALREGGQITSPLQDAFWGGYHGALTDRFGVHWMLNGPPSA